MNMFGLINIGVLPLLLEAMAPGYAQHEREAKHPAQEHQAEPEQQPRQAHPAAREPQPRQRDQQERQRGRPEQQALQPRPSRQDRQPQGHVERPRPMPSQEQARRSSGPRAQRREGQHRTIWQQHRAGNWQSEHRTWQDRGGYQGYRIPADRYRRHFGPQFGFRMFSFPLVEMGGFPRFQYQGFWFNVLDPWPEYWSVNWYGEDDMYIEYSDDGYYLYNRMHPMDRIAISVRIR